MRLIRIILLLVVAFTKAAIPLKAGAAPRTLNDVTDTLAVGEVGRTDIHLVGFTLTTRQIPTDGNIIISFPGGFSLGNVSTVFYSDNDFGQPDPGIDSVKIIGQVIVIKLDGTGSSASPGSRINLLIPAIVNSTRADNYTVTLTITDKLGTLLDGPNVSQPFALRPGPLVQLRLTPSNDTTIRAGTILVFSAVGMDQFSNQISNLLFTWELLKRPDSIGTLTGNILQATKTGRARVLVSTGTKRDSSGLITVLPGELDYFTLTGAPDTITAGVTFPAAITVTAFDQFDNTKTDYVGIIYFTATDSQASVPYPPNSPYHFQPADQGQKTFWGFVFYKSGVHKLSVSNGFVADSSSPILVMPDRIFDFRIGANILQTAGQSFIVTVTGAVDRFRNMSRGAVELAFVLGGNISPFGKAPILTPVQVQDGAGTTAIVLTTAEKVIVAGTVDTVSRHTDTIFVLPAPLDTFQVSIPSPQYSGTPFNESFISALDNYGNRVVSFNAASDTVVIVPETGGKMLDNVLKLSSDFVDGLGDLGAKGTTYIGAGGFQRFLVQSQSGKTGQSEPVRIQSLSAEKLNLFPPLVQRGQPLMVELVLTNTADVQPVIASIELLTDLGGFGTLSPYPGLPDTLPLNGSVTYVDTVTVPVDFPAGVARAWLRVLASYNSSPVIYYSPVLDSFTVVAPAFLVYDSSSLAPQTISKGFEYSFQVTVENQGTFPVVLDTLTTFQLQKGFDSLTFHLQQQTIVFQSQLQPALLTFKPLLIPATFGSGNFGAALRLQGTELEIGFEQAITIPDSVRFEAPPVISIVSALLPETLVTAKKAMVAIKIRNTGEAPLTVDSARTILVMLGRFDSLIFQPTSDLITVADTATINFAFIRGSGFGVFSLFLNLVGIHNKIESIYDFTFSGDSVIVIEAARVVFDSLVSLAPNKTKVDYAQPFFLRAQLRNSGAENAENVVLQIFSDRGSSHPDSISLSFLPGNSSGWVDIPIIAVNQSEIEQFIVTLTDWIGSISKSRSEAPPVSKQLGILIQKPTLLTPALRMKPVNFGGNWVLPDQQFTLEFFTQNLGEAQYDSGEVILLLQGSALLPLSDTISTFSEQSPGIFYLQAPKTEGTFTAIARISQVPHDLNTSQPASLTADSAILQIIVREQVPQLVASIIQAADPVMAPGEKKRLLTLLLRNYDNTQAHPLYVTELQVQTVNRQGQSLLAASLLASAEVVHRGSSLGTARFADDRFTLVLNDTLQILSNLEDTLELWVSARSEAQGEAIGFRLDSTSIVAFDFSPQRAPVRIYPALPSGETFVYQSGPFAISALQLAESFFSYPNPFSPFEGAVNFNYVLVTDSDVRLKIYDLTGDRVYETTFASGQEGGRKGRNKINWDGKNQAGKIVSNGVYIAILGLITTGEQVTTKVAIAK